MKKNRKELNIMKKVGASILNIITESLYDRPIVVFREYVQNSIDSFIAIDDRKPSELFCNIYTKDKDLYFFDNGNGILENEFLDKMKSIAFSGKNRINNIGYKGIGRLSGISYCKKISFVNIVDFSNKKIQLFNIDCIKYKEIQEQESYNSMSFDKLIDKISDTNVDGLDIYSISDDLLSDDDINKLKATNKGFLVIMKEVNSVLEATIQNNIINKLQWLLPVDFTNELKKQDDDFKQIINDISENSNMSNPLINFPIKYDGNIIERPLKFDMFKTYKCMFDFKYAIGFHSFNTDKIAIDAKNEFSGLRIYIDNMLLCDEVEVVSELEKFGLTKHTSSELIQTLRGIGAMIYITDKTSIITNARRTFIEVNDEDSFEFLKKLNQFVEYVYDARYALSKYASAVKNTALDAEKSKEKIARLREIANEALKNLSTRDIIVVDEKIKDFQDLADNEKARIIKKSLTQRMNEKIKMFVSQMGEYNLDSSYENFKVWLKSNL